MDAASIGSDKRVDQLSIDKLMLAKMNNLQDNFYAYIPKKIYHRLLKSKAQFAVELKHKISQKFLKKQQNDIFEMKIKILRSFNKFNEFMSTNHRLQSK